MRRTFSPVDDLLIERVFQPASDLLLHQIGLGRMAAACFCLDAASLAWIVSQARGLGGPVTDWDTAPALFDVSLLLLGLVALISLRTLFKRAAGKRGNPLRPAMRPHRAVVLLMLAGDLVRMHAPELGNVSEVVMLVCSASGLYLGACTERPPVRQGRSWLVQAAGRA